MHTISQNVVLANLPFIELDQTIEQFLQPVTERLPDKRLMGNYQTRRQLSRFLGSMSIP